eukprot:c12236_g1_i1 orf=105-347(+)
MMIISASACSFVEIYGRNKKTNQVAETSPLYKTSCCFIILILYTSINTQSVSANAEICRKCHFSDPTFILPMKQNLFHPL